MKKETGSEDSLSSSSTAAAATPTMTDPKTDDTGAFNEERAGSPPVSTTISTIHGKEIGFVTVMDARTHDTMRFGYTATSTLAQLKLNIRRDLFQQQIATTISDSTNARCDSPSLHVDGTLQLFWLGKELKEGCSWHTVGVIEEEDVVLMKDLDFGTKFGGMATATITESTPSTTAARAESQQRPIIHAHFQPPPSSFSLQQHEEGEEDNYD